MAGGGKGGRCMKGTRGVGGLMAAGLLLAPHNEGGGAFLPAPPRFAEADPTNLHMLIESLPIGILILLAAAFAGGTILLSSLTGPKHPTPEKLAPYECGITPVGSPRDRFA